MGHLGTRVFLYIWDQELILRWHQPCVSLKEEEKGLTGLLVTWHYTCKYLCIQVTTSRMLDSFQRVSHLLSAYWVFLNLKWRAIPKGYPQLPLSILTSFFFSFLLCLCTGSLSLEGEWGWGLIMPSQCQSFQKSQLSNQKDMATYPLILTSGLAFSGRAVESRSKVSETIALRIFSQ